jgi:DNA-binding NarL/FixJ family response regulator
MIRLIAVEDDERYRGSLEMLFRHAADFELLQAFDSPAPALALIEEAVQRTSGPGIELVLMDLDLPEIGGIECTRRIKALAPDVAVVVLTVFDVRTAVIDAICAGADGYLLTHSAAELLLAELRSVAAGGSVLSPGIARLLLEAVRQNPRSAQTPRGVPGLELTQREQDVLRCLVRGMSYKRTARQLDISIHTVRSHIRGIYGKLRVHSVAEAVSKAIRERIV